jgi:hypothetical protein
LQPLADLPDQADNLRFLIALDGDQGRARANEHLQIVQGAFRGQGADMREFVRRQIHSRLKTPLTVATIKKKPQIQLTTAPIDHWQFTVGNLISRL